MIFFIVPDIKLLKNFENVYLAVATFLKTLDTVSTFPLFAIKKYVSQDLKEMIFLLFSR